MIRVRVYRDAAAYITGFDTVGHAHAGEPGHDIVCAAVSALTHTAIMSLERHAAVKPVLDMDQPSGKMHVRLPSGLSGSRQQRVQLILETMVLGLDEIAKEYGAYIAVKQTQEP